ncbi:DUF4825 domain-containing protein [Paenibacillus daejeonensis]|uniref:DUF4825 domain-containing protein n=1 Tax=Paenibacillus daejeonensis TaxID=135193 RepID=UPI00037B383D|nr:DUF4825 domain-containing protein [Paenibacillus daejeonensis]
MKKRTWIIISLLVIAVSLFIFVEGVYIPDQEAQREQYQAEQLNPLTHHLDEVLPYQHPYMGNAGNLSNLFFHLPLQDLSFTFQLYPDELTAALIFDTSAAQVDQLHLQRSLIYNSTAAFALIDNLETLRYTFSDDTYIVERSAVVRQYGELSALLEPQIWQATVQDPLKNSAHEQELWRDLVQLSS